MQPDSDKYEPLYLRTCVVIQYYYNMVVYIFVYIFIFQNL
jgi:hypothetical protein